MGMTTWPLLSYSNSWSITCQGKNLEPSNLDSSIRFLYVYESTFLPPSNHDSSMRFSLEPAFLPPTMMMPIPSGDVTMA